MERMFDMGCWIPLAILVVAVILILVFLASPPRSSE